MNRTPEEAFQAGVLHRPVHERLVEAISDVTRDAAVHPSFVYTPIDEFVSKGEALWVRRFRQHAHDGYAGLCYVGPFNPPVEDRMAAIAGALLRNFIRAKVMTLQSIAQAARENDLPQASCLLVPNFFTRKSEGGGLDHWKIGLLQEVLLTRWAERQQTVLYCSSLDSLGSEYGAFFRQHIEAHYFVIDGAAL